MCNCCCCCYYYYYLQPVYSSGLAIYPDPPALVAITSASLQGHTAIDVTLQVDDVTQDYQVAWALSSHGEQFTVWHHAQSLVFHTAAHQASTRIICFMVNSTDMSHCSSIFRGSALDCWSTGQAIDPTPGA